MKRQLTIAHSPDSDDAYMMAPLAMEWLGGDDDFQRFEITFVRKDIEALNQDAMVGKHDVTAISFAVYPEVEKKYDLLRSGSSIQEGTGPILVAKERLAAEDLGGRRIAIPGTRTSAYLAMCQWMPGLSAEAMPFDKIMDAVAQGHFDAGLLIHESQLMYEAKGLHLVTDLGAWWKKQHDLPLPMGGNAIRKELPIDEKRVFARLMRKTVETAMQRHEESLDYAQSFGRGMDRSMVDRYVKAWVNEFTIDVGPRGAQAVNLLLKKQVPWLEHLDEQ
jgi:1,4-dihydroxy-6-naphthoate synthase